MKAPLTRDRAGAPPSPRLPEIPSETRQDSRLALPNVRRGLILGIFVLGAGLRLAGLGTVGVNSDEAVYLGQAAALAEAPGFEELFPIFRAHPLLLQVALSVLFRFGVNDIAGRLVSVLIGLATVWMVYLLGQTLYGPRVGLVSALLLAVMPYHVVVSRQVLLDVPMAYFSTLTLYLLARYAANLQPAWLYAAGASMGLVFLSKETGIVLLGAIYASLALSPNIRVRLRDLVASLGTMAIVMLPYPLTLALAGGAGAGRTQQYLVWQLSRRPNHDWTFYPGDVLPSMGVPLLMAAVLGFILLRRQNSRKEALLVSWVVVPVLFFEMWPVKGFHYLLLTAPPFAILAARTLAVWPQALTVRVRGRSFPSAWIRAGLTAAVVLLLVGASWHRIHPPTADRFLAGSGGVPGGREAGLWLRENTPEGSSLMTIGPSMANILQFYGHRRALGLSVSPNPLHRNPAYTPIRNPDFDIRTGEIQYLIWDAYSAGRSSFFADKILAYAVRYDGRVVHIEAVPVRSPEGGEVFTPIIVVYEVRP